MLFPNGDPRSVAPGDELMGSTPECSDEFAVGMHDNLDESRYIYIVPYVYNVDVTYTLFRTYKYTLFRTYAMLT